MSVAKIVLIEDNRADVLLVREALSEHLAAFDLHVIEDGAQAIDYVAQLAEPGSAPPDIMLLDLNLPKVDGIEVLAQIRNQEFSSAIPVVVISSSDAPRDQSRVAGFGPARFFRKPLDLDQFLKLGEVVREILQDRGQAPPAGR